MSYVLFGLTIIVSVVIAMGLFTVISWKLMMSPKVWKKLFDQSYAAMASMNFDSLACDVDDEDDEDEEEA